MATELDEIQAMINEIQGGGAAPAAMATPMPTMAAQAPAPDLAQSLAAALGPKKEEKGWGNWLTSRAADVFGGVALAGGGLIDLGLAAPTFVANRVGADLPYFPTSGYISQGWPETMQAVGLEPSPMVQEATSWMYPMAKAAKGAQMVGGAVGYGTSELAKALAPESTATQILAPLVSGGLAQKAASAKNLGLLLGNQNVIDEVAQEKVLNILTPEQKVTLGQALEAGQGVGSMGVTRPLAGVVQAPNVAAAQAVVGQSVAGQPIIAQAMDNWRTALNAALESVGYNVNEANVQSIAEDVLERKQAAVVAGQQFDPTEFGKKLQAGELSEEMRSVAQSKAEEAADALNEAAKKLDIPSEPIDQAAAGKTVRTQLEAMRQKAKAIEQTYWDKVDFNQPIDLRKFAIDTLEALRDFTPEVVGLNSNITALKRRLLELVPDAEGMVQREGTVRDYKDIYELAFNASREKHNFTDAKLLGRVKAVYNELKDFNLELATDKTPAAKEAIKRVNEARQATKLYYDKYGRGPAGSILATKGGEFRLAAENIANALVGKLANAAKLMRDFGGDVSAPPIIAARKELLARLNQQVAPDKFLAERETLFKTLFPQEFDIIQKYVNQKQTPTGFEQYKAISESMIPRKVFADETSVRNFVDAFGGLENNFYIDAAKGTFLSNLLDQAKKGSLTDVLRQNENKARILFGDDFDRVMRAADVHDQAKAISLKEAMASPEAAAKAITDSDVQDWLKKVFVGKVIEEGKRKTALGKPRGFQEALSQRMDVAEVLYKEQGTEQLASTLEDLQRFEDVATLAKQPALGGSPTNLWSTTIGALKDPGGFLKMVQRAGNALTGGSALYAAANLWQGKIAKVAQAVTTLAVGTAMSGLAKTRTEQIAKAEAHIFANPQLLKEALAPPTQQNVERFLRSLETMGILTAKAGANAERPEEAKAAPATTPKVSGGRSSNDLFQELEKLAIPSAGAEERMAPARPAAAAETATVGKTQVSIPTGSSYAPPALVRAVIQAESRGNPRAVSNKGAGGLMQLMPATAKALGVSPQDRFNPQKNVEAGSRYLQQMITKFGDVKLALAAYNHGPGNIRKKMAAVTEGGKGVTYEDIKTYLPAETRAYVAKIMKNVG